ncbi:MAG: thiamine pyrophosphate-dependent enzyme, partial [Alphaproteobacteria bacterium]|nr:thiamine pyrophosphate-dependent enzyme [Alphaproteobacteria bacterium]
RDYVSYCAAGSCDGPLDLKEVFKILRRQLPDDGILTVGAGAYALWPQRYFYHRRLGTQIGPKSGAMGYGLPAAIAAALYARGKTVVAVAGDGCLLMQAEELATAVNYKIPIIVLVINNNYYGAIQAGQRRLFGRETGTALTSPNFVQYAAAFGAHAERVTSTDEFETAWERALQAEGPALIELVVGLEALKPRD